MNPLRGLMQGKNESYDANFNVSLNRGLMSFTEPVPEFTPLQLKPALWLDASDQLTLYQDRTGASATTLVSEDANPVGTWKDKSGNGRHVTAPSDAARPTYKVGIQNGRSIARFDGVNDVLTITSAMITNKANVVMFLVSKYASGYPGINNYNAISSGGLSLYSFFDDTARFDGRPLISGAFNSQKSTQKSLILTAFNILTGVYTTSDMTVYVNGASGTPLSFSSTHCGGYSNFSIGCVTRENADFGAGDFCEVIVFDKALSTSQRQQVERYLANKWGIIVI